MSMFWLQTWGGGERERDHCLLWILCSLELVLLGWNCWHPFLQRVLHLTLLRFHWDMLRFLKRKCILAPFEAEPELWKEKFYCVLGISIHIQLAFTGGNGIFCIELLLNWVFPKKALFHFMVVFIIICFWRNLPRVTDQKALLLVQNIFIYIPSWWCNIFKIALMLCLIPGLSTCF